MKVKKITIQLIAFFWSITIFYLCFLPATNLPKDDFYNKIYFDKIVHFGLYFVQFFLWIFAFSTTKKIQFILSIFLCVTQGILVEMVQNSSLVQGRSFDVFDIIANIFGVIIAYLFFDRNRKYFLQKIDTINLN